MTIEAMKQALEALLEINELSKGENAICLPAEIDGAMDALRTAIAEAEKQEPVAWMNVALRLGEELSSVGPAGYYNMTAAQWLDWALEQQPRGKNSLTTPPAAQRQHVTDGSLCWCEPETSYTDPETGASVIVHKEPQ
jgi:hypothetical protein